MKNIFSLLGLAVAVVSGGFAAAQSFEYEVVRSPESPGFFMLRVLPGESLPDMLVDTVMVTDDDMPTFLTDTESFMGMKVFSIADIADIPEDSKTVGVGSEALRDMVDMYFAVTPETSQERVQVFLQKYTGDVHAKGIRVDFDDAVASDVYAWGTEYLTHRGAIFVGKYNLALPTEATVSGVTKAGEVSERAAIGLHIPSPMEDNLQYRLGDLWEEIDRLHRIKTKNMVEDTVEEKEQKVLENNISKENAIENNNQKKEEQIVIDKTENKEDIMSNWQEKLPWVLGGLGLLLLVWNVAYLFRKRREAVVWEERKAESAELEDVLDHWSELKVKADNAPENLETDPRLKQEYEGELFKIDEKPEYLLSKQERAEIQDLTRPIIRETEEFFN